MSRREFKSDTKILSRCAVAGKRMPTEDNDSLYIHMIGDIGEKENIWLNSFYYWVIVYIGHGNPVCIVIIFYLIVNTYGFAHPKKDIDKDVLRDLSEAAGKSKFVVVDRFGHIVSPMSVTYLGFTRKVTRSIKRILESDTRLEAYVAVLPSEVLKRVLTDLSPRQSESYFLECILSLRKLQMLVDFQGDEEARSIFTDLILSAAVGIAEDDSSVTVTPFLLPDSDGKSLSGVDIIYFCLMSRQIPVNRALPETGDDKVARKMVDMIVSSKYLMDYSPQTSFEEDKDEGVVTGRYPDGVSFSSCRYDRAKFEEVLGYGVELSGDGTVYSVLKNNTLTGFITVESQDKVSPQTDLMTFPKKVSTLLPKSICQNCSPVLGFLIPVVYCCHADMKGRKYRCVCTSLDDKDRIEEINDLIGKGSVTIKKRSPGKKQKQSDSPILCVVCKSGIKCALQVPCFHLLLCYSCSVSEDVSETCIECSEAVESYIYYTQGQEDSLLVKVEDSTVKSEEDFHKTETNEAKAASTATGGDATAVSTDAQTVSAGTVSEEWRFDSGGFPQRAAYLSLIHI